MKKIYLIALLVCAAATVNAQDEGTISKKERFLFNQGIVIGGGPSVPLSKDIGDYSAGVSFEIGYVKRLNRVISIGPSVSYLSFKYDKKVTANDYKNIFIGGPYDFQGYPYYEGDIFTLKGGDLSLISLGANIKINLIPVTNTSVVSVYGFVKPFVSYVKRTAISGNLLVITNYGDPYNADDWAYYAENSSQTLEWKAGTPLFDIDGDGDIDYVSDDLKEQTSITGGVFVGPGVEFMPAKRVSIYLQAAFGYTLPVSFVNTEHYSNDENLGNDVDYFIQNGGEKYPTQKKGFSSINIQGGVTINF